MFAFRTYWSRAPGQHLHAISVGLALLGQFYTLFTLVSRSWGHFTRYLRWSRAPGILISNNNKVCKRTSLLKPTFSPSEPWLLLNFLDRLNMFNANNWNRVCERSSLLKVFVSDDCYTLSVHFPNLHTYRVCNTISVLKPACSPSEPWFLLNLQRSSCRTIELTDQVL